MAKLSRQEEYAERVYTLLSDPAISEDAKLSVEKSIQAAENGYEGKMETGKSADDRADSIAGDLLDRICTFKQRQEGIAQAIREAEERGRVEERASALNAMRVAMWEWEGEQAEDKGELVVSLSERITSKIHERALPTAPQSQEVKG